MELKVFESPGKEWDDFASRYTDLIFYQSIWSEVLRKGLAGQPLYFYLKEGEEIVAGLPGVLLNFRVIKILYASIPYGNFIGQKSRFPVFTELLENEFRRRRIDQVRITECPFFESYGPRSFTSESSKCSLLNLEKFDEGKIREGYRSEVRRAIRKAEANGLSVKRVTSRDAAKIFYRLYLSSMKRNRAAAKYPLRWFETLLEVLAPVGRADIFFAVKGSEWAAGVVLISSSTSNHYLHNGSNEAYLGSRPNDLLVDRIIQESVQEGKRTLDFMGSDAHDLALLRFKEKWGSQSVDHHTYVKDYHPLRCRLWEVSRRWARSKIGRGLSRWVQN